MPTPLCDVHHSSMQSPVWKCAEYGCRRRFDTQHGYFTFVNERRVDINKNPCPKCGAARLIASVKDGKEEWVCADPQCLDRPSKTSVRGGVPV